MAPPREDIERMIAAKAVESVWIRRLRSKAYYWLKLDDRFVARIWKSGNAPGMTDSSHAFEGR